MKDEKGNHINDFWDVAYGGVFSSKHTDGSNKPAYYGNYTDKNNKWYPWDNWYSSPMFWFKWIGILLLTLLILGIGTCTYHHHKYKCVEWHKHWQRRTGRFESGYHWVYHCDKEVLRTEYEKNINKYPNANNGCGCQ